jgi:ACS family tartrate transporter-like MFS transporter
LAFVFIVPTDQKSVVRRRRTSDPAHQPTDGSPKLAIRPIPRNVPATGGVRLSMNDDVESTTIKAVAWRLLPLVFLLYFLSLVDRTNLGIGALTMNHDLGLSIAAYSLGVAAFFFGYIPFEIPSNLILERIGARLWIGRIAITWGLVASAMALVSGQTSFLVVRFLLGTAEAGLFPGMLLYLTYWFPSAYRARVNAALVLAIPASTVIGAPLGSSLLELNGLLGLSGWRWMFILEGLPSVILGLVVLRRLTDHPANATWLRADQRQWLESTLTRERAAVESAHSRLSLWRGLVDPRVLALCLVYFAFGSTSYGMAYFLPQFIKQWGLSNLATGWTVAGPETLGIIGLLVWSYYSDRVGNRRASLTIALLIAAAGLTGMALYGGSAWSLIAVCMVTVGYSAARPMFWALPPAFLSRTAMAGAIALISCFANVGGIIAPLAIGWAKTATGSFAGGLYFIAAATLMAAMIILFLIGPAVITPASAPQEGSA